MCGIAGIWGSTDSDRLDRMAIALRHRGPEETGTWNAPATPVGFVHTRLAIIDIRRGQQPIANEDGSIVTVFNGEIYNYRELREDLIARGHQFKTDGDTEVLVHLYEDLGPAMLAKLRGMFALVIWDNRKQQLFLARDRIGKKPLYYSESNGEFIFASEIKGVLSALKSSPTINEQAIVDFLGWGAIHAPGTIYDEVRSLCPGEWLMVRDRHIATRQIYWRMAMSPKLDLSRQEAVERIDETLQESVDLRLRSDVPLGCFLSGGIDSGLITAMAASRVSGALTTITIGFENSDFDERSLAKLVSERYGTDHHEIVIQPNVIDDLPDILRNYDQPFGSASAIPSYYVAKAAREKVKVVLNGDGGDELFAGYRRYIAAHYSRYIPGVDGPALRWLWRSMARMLPTPQRFRSKYAFVHRFLRGLGQSSEDRFLTWTIDGLDHQVLKKLYRNDPGHSPSSRLVSLNAQDGAALGPVDRMLAIDFETVLPHDLLVKMDIATMAHSLEARSPLLDHELVEMVARYPESYKLSGATTKPLLRELAIKYLPTAIQTAPKRGFEVPLVSWLRHDLKAMSHDIILSREGLIAQRFDRPSLEHLLRGDRLDPGRWSRQVWHLLVLGIWDKEVRQSSPSTPASENP